MDGAEFFVGILITQNASKYSISTKNTKKILAPPSGDGDTPSPHPTPLGAYGALTPSVLKSWVRHCPYWFQTGGGRAARNRPKGNVEIP